MKIRASGVLLHLVSLPSDFGIGDLGPWAYRFADFLAELKQAYWQILPLGPTSPAIGNSPYSSFSAYAGNPILISPEGLVEMGLLSQRDLNGLGSVDPRRVAYEAVSLHKENLLRLIFGRVADLLEAEREFTIFCEEERFWLDDYALFMALKNHFNGAIWSSWPEEFRDRNPDALSIWREANARHVRFEKFCQYLFFKQWRALKKYCGKRMVNLVGDAPIYVTYDSADVWANHRIFKLDKDKQPTVVAGVPPDYFSRTGQLWGNPVYDWDALREENFGWWIRRIEHNLRLFDYIRLDHFRGFAAYWAVPAEEKTAVNGEWVDVPGEELFSAMCRRLPSLPIIAEDLGYITADVHALKRRFGFPGMRILQFAFGVDLPTSPHVPHMHEENCVVYTGTHDNNTVNGWFYLEADAETRRRFLTYAGSDGDEREAHLKCLRLAMGSVANTVITPMQDLLGFGPDGRMNTPSVAKGNWEWRLLREEMDTRRFASFAAMTRFYGRC